VHVAELAALEALADPRLQPVQEGELAAELEAHFPDVRVELESLPRFDAAELDEARRARAVEWAARTVTYGEVLDAFASYCRDDVDELEVVEEGPVRLRLGWRRDVHDVELRAAFLFCERLPGAEPALLLGDLGAAAPQRFAADAALRARLALYDLGRLEKVNAVRSSIVVHFEWFLRDVYGVKLLPANAFTQGLIDRGVISLGMG
jgi:hypothetical protein